MESVTPAWAWTRSTFTGSIWSMRARREPTHQTVWRPRSARTGPRRGPPPVPRARRLRLRLRPQAKPPPVCGRRRARRVLQVRGDLVTVQERRQTQGPRGWRARMRWLGRPTPEVADLGLEEGPAALELGDVARTSAAMVSAARVANSACSICSSSWRTCSVCLARCCRGCPLRRRSAWKGEDRCDAVWVIG